MSPEGGQFRNGFSYLQAVCKNFTFFSKGILRWEIWTLKEKWFVKNFRYLT